MTHVRDFELTWHDNDGHPDSISFTMKDADAHALISDILGRFQQQPEDDARP